MGIIEKMRLDGKKGFVTGGARGIGKCTATAFAEAGADLITVHYEACGNVKETLAAIRETGKKVGITIKPGTDVSVLEDYIEDVDLILIMSVEPGFGGQKLLPETYERLKKVRKMISGMKKPPLLEVDGGITLDNVKDILEAGADTIVAGSSVFRGDIAENVTAFEKILKNKAGGKGAPLR